MTQEPEWIDVTVFGSRYEVQLDVCSPNGQQRHRYRPYTGESVSDWIMGPAPKE